MISNILENKENVQNYFTMPVAVIILFLTLGCNPRALPFIRDKLKANDEMNTKNTEEAVKTDEKLRELDDLCKSIPLPDSFKFYSKSRSVKGSDLIFVYYYSDDDFNNSDKYFREYFSSNQWSVTEDNSVNKTTEFRKDDKRIVIQYGGIGIDANYAFSCKRIIDGKD
jgi:hypothetical protein